MSSKKRSARKRKFSSIKQQRISKKCSKKASIQQVNSIVSKNKAPIGAVPANKYLRFAKPVLKYSAFFLVFVFASLFFITVFPRIIDNGMEEEKAIFFTDKNVKNALLKHSNEQPALWGELLDEVITHFHTDKMELALTLDACGGKHGSGADNKLINFLLDNKIKATLFINVRWIDKNKELFLKIVDSDLFDIENHGLEHAPLSVTPRTVYGISGTGTPLKTINEVEVGALTIQGFTGRKPLFFRSGTAYYDDVSLKILSDMGYRAVAFSVNADEGAKLPADKIYKHMMNVKGGDIIIAHMNKPQGQTSLGLTESIRELAKKGFIFVKLSEVDALQMQSGSE